MTTACAWLFTTLLLLLVPSVAVGQRNVPQARALVVGISSYPKVRPGLEFAHRDAEAVATFLRTPQGGSFTVTLLQNEQATRQAIYTALDSLGRVTQPGDVFYFFFAGHSLVGADATPYLMPYDGDERIPGANGITANFLGQISSYVGQASRVVVFIDACNSGALLDPAGLAARGSEDFVQALNSVWRQDLARGTTTPGRIVMGFFSAGPHQLSFEHRALGHGLFTHYLLQGLEGGADGFSPGVPADGVVRAYELRDFLWKKVSEHSRTHFERSQDPTVSPLFDRDFALATTGAGLRHTWASTPTAVPPQPNPSPAPARARRAPTDGELVLHTGETTPVGALQTVLGVWHSYLPGDPTSRVNVRLNGEESTLGRGDYVEFTHAGGACRVRYLSSADPDPLVREDETHRFSLVCRSGVSTRYPPPLRRENPSWEPDIWLPLERRAVLAGAQFGVTNWGVGINVWRSSIYVGLNGEEHKLWAGDRLEVPGTDGHCFVAYIRTQDPDIRVEGDEHHGFSLLCDDERGRADAPSREISTDVDLWLIGNRSARVCDNDHMFGVKSWGMGVGVDLGDIFVALNGQEVKMMAGSRLSFPCAGGTCHIGWIVSEDPKPNSEGDERHGFAVSCGRPSNP